MKFYAIRQSSMMDGSFSYFLKSKWWGDYFTETPRLLFNTLESATSAMNDFKRENARKNKGRVTYKLDIVELTEKVVEDDHD